MANPGMQPKCDHYSGRNWEKRYETKSRSSFAASSRSWNNCYEIIPGDSAMKDKRDKSTADIFTGQRPVGRPRVHESNAEKQKQYRNRKKQAI